MESQKFMRLLYQDYERYIWRNFLWQVACMILMFVGCLVAGIAFRGHYWYIVVPLLVVYAYLMNLFFQGRRRRYARLLETLGEVWGQ